MEEWYRQCVIVANGKTEVSWIPEKYAKIGRKIIIDNEKYTVEHVYGRMDFEEARKREVDYKKQRSVSDI